MIPYAQQRCEQPGCDDAPEWGCDGCGGAYCSDHLWGGGEEHPSLCSDCGGFR